MQKINCSNSELNLITLHNLSVGVGERVVATASQTMPEIKKQREKTREFRIEISKGVDNCGNKMFYHLVYREKKKEREYIITSKAILFILIANFLHYS